MIVHFIGYVERAVKTEIQKWMLKFDYICKNEVVSEPPKKKKKSVRVDTVDFNGILLIVVLVCIYFSVKFHVIVF